MIKDEITFITRTKRKISSTGLEIEQDQLTVQGKSLDECRKHFDELWSEYSDVANTVKEVLSEFEVIIKDIESRGFSGGVLAAFKDGLFNAERIIKEKFGEELIK